jgi:DNA topoisomerase-1
MTTDDVTLEQALMLLSLPREVGTHPEDQEPVRATNGRYGPYLTWGKETRSLESEEQIFTVDLAAALAILAQPKQRGRRAAAGPLKDLGQDPVTKLHVVVKTGKFGDYVTDGEANATLRNADTVENLTLDRACELLAERRNAEPSTRPRKAVKKAAKKVVKKASKKPTKKVAAKATGATKRAATAAGAAKNAALAAQAKSSEAF